MLKFVAANISILHNTCQSNSLKNVCHIVKRYRLCDKKFSIPEPEELPKYEISRDPKEWEYVERLMQAPMICDYPKKKEYPSGWTPPSYNPNSKYVIERSKNHQLPIYLRIPSSKRGMQRNTAIKKVHGDIWMCAVDVKKYLEKLEQEKPLPRPIHMKVHEITGQIIVRGDHVNDVKVWALSKKF